MFALAAAFGFVCFVCDQVCLFGWCASGGADLSGFWLGALVGVAELVGCFGACGWLGWLVAHEVVECLVDCCGGVFGE